MRLEPLQFYSDLLRYPLSRENGMKSIRLALLLAISQAANAFGFVYEKIWPCHSLQRLEPAL